jgi:hypothetical protein
MLNLSWAKHEDDRWFALESVDLSDLHITGVCIIWHAGQASRVVTIGSGDIAARLLTRRADKAISAYKAQGRLLVTWAAVAAHQLDAVESYLVEHWNPLIEERFPDVAPIEVNSPWE